MFPGCNNADSPLLVGFGTKSGVSVRGNMSAVLCLQSTRSEQLIPERITYSVHVTAPPDTRCAA